VPRQDVPTTLNALLDRFTIEDISVEDRPLEEAMAELFTDSGNDSKTHLP
jgi:ABC-2 type transport system ATP-binding protein